MPARAGSAECLATFFRKTEINDLKGVEMALSKKEVDNYKTCQGKLGGLSDEGLSDEECSLTVKMSLIPPTGLADADEDGVEDGGENDGSSRMATVLDADHEDGPPMDGRKTLPPVVRDIEDIPITPLGPPSQMLTRNLIMGWVEVVLAQWTRRFSEGGADVDGRLARNTAVAFATDLTDALEGAGIHHLTKVQMEVARVVLAEGRHNVFTLSML